VGEHALIHQAFEHAVQRGLGKGQAVFQFGEPQRVFGLGKGIEQHQRFGDGAIAWQAGFAGGSRLGLAACGCHAGGGRRASCGVGLVRLC
jgi:hypothetical protein